MDMGGRLGSCGGRSLKKGICCSQTLSAHCSTKPPLKLGGPGLYAHNPSRPRRPRQGGMWVESGAPETAQLGRLDRLIPGTNVVMSCKTRARNDKELQLGMEEATEL